MNGPNAGETEGQWLAELQHGDPVLIERGHGRTEYTRAVVQAATPKYITVSGMKFRRRGGHLAAGVFATCHLVQPTPERVNEIDRTDLAYKLRTVDWLKLSLPTLTQVYGLVASELPPPSP